MADVISLFREVESKAAPIAATGAVGLSFHMEDLVTARALLIEVAQDLCQAQKQLESLVRRTIEPEAGQNLAGNWREA